MAKLTRPITDTEGKHAGWLVWCEPCGTHKVFDQRWTFDGNEESPTFSPSMKLTGFGSRSRPEGYVCHSYVRNGQWEYLSDSTHALAGKTVPIASRFGDDE